MDFEQFRHWVLTCVEDIGRGFTRPDDNRIPVLLFQNPKGGGVAALDPAFFDDAAGKDQLASTLAQLIVDNHVTAYALVIEVWASEIDTRPSQPSNPRSRGLRRGALLPEHDPLRKELLWLTLTDDVHDEMWMAEVLRSPRHPPRLGRWERIDLKNPGSGVLTGRFIEPLRTALQRARASNN